MADVKISDMTAAQTIGNSDLIELSQENSGSYTSAKTTISALKTKIAGTEVTGTLTAGQTSLTLQDASITSSSTLDFYTSIYGVNPTNVSVSTGSVTLTFEAQSSNMSVKVRVS